MVKVCNDKKGTDKWYHRFSCLIVAIIVGAILASIPLGIPSWSKALIAFAVAMRIGVWKELRDSRQSGNHFCIWDLKADAGGALIGALFAWLCAWCATHDISGNLL